MLFNSQEAFMELDISLIACPRDQLSEAGEFRKVNALLHGVDNNMMAVSKCTYIPLSKEVLEKLQAILAKLTPLNCAEVFPMQDGLFYGSTKYDEYYWNDVQDVKEWVDKTLTEFDVEEEALFFSAW